MKYPKLPEELDLRKKLLSQDIKDIQQAYMSALPFPPQGELARARREDPSVQSKRQWILDIAQMYGVSAHTIYYWTHDDYRAMKMLKNAKAHSKANLEDYEAHRAAEIKGRARRMKTNPKLADYHAVQSAKNERRSNRQTVKGTPLNDWLNS